jgi:hypothetical protein
MNIGVSAGIRPATGRKSMSRYELRGHDLYDTHRRRIATARGLAIYDGNNQRIGVVRGDDLYDTEERRMATLRGSDIFDSDSMKVGSLSDVQDSIKGAEVGVMDVALWYCFVR